MVPDALQARSRASHIVRECTTSFVQRPVAARRAAQPLSLLRAAAPSSGDASPALGLLLSSQRAAVLDAADRQLAELCSSMSTPEEQAECWCVHANACTQAGQGVDAMLLPTQLPPFAPGRPIDNTISCQYAGRSTSFTQTAGLRRKQAARTSWLLMVTRALHVHLSTAWSAWCTRLSMLVQSNCTVPCWCRVISPSEQPAAHRHRHDLRNHRSLRRRVQQTRCAQGQTSCLR